jgi:hypothetical protein
MKPMMSELPRVSVVAILTATIIIIIIVSHKILPIKKHGTIHQQSDAVKGLTDFRNFYEFTDSPMSTWLFLRHRFTYCTSPIQ